jgi:hypothetical protein
MDIFVRQIFGNTFGQVLCGLAATVLTLCKEGLGEYVSVAVDDTKDERILILALRSLTELNFQKKNYIHTATDSIADMCLLRVAICTLCAFISRSETSSAVE